MTIRQCGASSTNGCRPSRRCGGSSADPPGVGSAVVLTVAVTALSGQGWTWPYLLAALPAVLDGSAGLTVLVSVASPVRQKDPRLRTSPFGTGDDPTPPRRCWAGST
jgi:hypothetical protein